MVNQRLYFYHLEQLTLEIEGEQSLTLLRGADQPLAERHGINSGADTRLLMTDVQHSLLLMQSGQARMAYAYTAYGHDPRSQPAATRLGFNGEYREQLTGAYLLGQGYRAFNPILMRFQAPDSLSPFGEGGVNAYGYCSGDPINYSDPAGHARGFVMLIPRARITKKMWLDKPQPAPTPTPRKHVQTNKRVQFDLTYVNDPTLSSAYPGLIQPEKRKSNIKQSADSDRLMTRAGNQSDALSQDYMDFLNLYRETTEKLARAQAYVNFKNIRAQANVNVKNIREQSISLDNIARIKKMKSRHETLRKLYYAYHTNNS